MLVKVINMNVIKNLLKAFKPKNKIISKEYQNVYEYHYDIINQYIKDNNISEDTIEKDYPSLYKDREKIKAKIAEQNIIREYMKQRINYLQMLSAMARDINEQYVLKGK